MPEPARRDADSIICGRLESLAEEDGAAFVLGYLALPDEVRIDAFLAVMIDRGKQTLLPRAAGGRLHYGAWRPSTRLSRDEEGVFAPAAGCLDLMPDASGLIVIPGRAFDSSGQRLGRGGGYYDRFLAMLGTSRTVIGVAYECQIVDAVPAEAHDRRVDCIVTEAGCRGTGRKLPLPAESRR